MSVSFNWIDMPKGIPPKSIQITKSDETKLVLNVGDCFEAVVSDGRGKNTKQVFKVTHFGYEGNFEKLTKIYSKRWSKSNNEWTDGRLFELTTTHLDVNSVNSITICHCPSLPPYNGGKKTRLKSRKNSSKKTRRITRRR